MSACFIVIDLDQTEPLKGHSKLQKTVFCNLFFVVVVFFLFFFFFFKTKKGCLADKLHEMSSHAFSEK